MKDNNSLKIVIIAFSANLFIAFVKFIVYLLTSSSSMLSEAIHSLADTGNQLLLFWGNIRSRKKPDITHPFGYSRESFLWGFIVAIQLFLLGGIYSIYKGFHKLLNPEPLKNFSFALIVLIISFMAEGYSFLKAKKVVDSEKGKMGLLEFIKRSYNTEINVVFIEDFAAMIGLGIAFLAIMLSKLFNCAFIDGIGSLLIGFLLVGVSLFLGREMESLIIGEAAPPEVIEYFKKILKSTEGIEEIKEIKSMILGTESIMLASNIKFKGELNSYEIGKLIDKIENVIKSKYPEVKIIYIEPQT